MGSRKTAFGIALAVLAPLAVGAAIVASNSEHTFTAGSKDAIVYSGTATQADASMLALALRANRYFQDSGAMVLLSRSDAGSVVSFVVKEGVWNDPQYVAGFEQVGKQVAPAVGGTPFTLRLVDRYRRTKKELVIDAGAGEGETAAQDGWY